MGIQGWRRFAFLRPEDFIELSSLPKDDPKRKSIKLQDSSIANISPIAKDLFIAERLLAIHKEGFPTLSEIINPPPEEELISTIEVDYDECEEEDEAPQMEEERSYASESVVQTKSSRSGKN